LEKDLELDWDLMMLPVQQMIQVKEN